MMAVGADYSRSMAAQQGLWRLCGCAFAFVSGGMRKNAMNSISSTTIAAAPTPMPALAPVLRLSEDEEEAFGVGDEGTLVEEVAEADIDVPLEVALDIDCVDRASPA